MRKTGIIQSTRSVLVGKATSRWARAYLLKPFRRTRDAVARFVIGQLTKPLKHYTLTYTNNLVELKRQLRKGDVILIEGNERVSQVIKYLTQSSWSHSTLYVGDEAIKRDPELRLRLAQEYGEEANYMVVEALMQSGVVLTPIASYRDFNIRICRPYRLAESDLKIVMHEALASVGRKYDLRNIFDLARYFLPVSLLPARFRYHTLQFGSGDPTRAICSSMIAECFHKVPYPIVPRIEPRSADYPAVQDRSQRLSKLISRRPHLPPGLYHIISPLLVTPRDFDLSPYFNIVKVNLIAETRFDYRRIIWADGAPAAIAPHVCEIAKTREAVESSPWTAVRVCRWRGVAPVDLDHSPRPEGSYRPNQKPENFR